MRSESNGDSIITEAFSFVTNLLLIKAIIDKVFKMKGYLCKGG